MKLLKEPIECNSNGFGDCSMCDYKYLDEKCSDHIYELLTNYLLQNGVFVLPAKVGDKIYTIQGAKIKENIIARIEISQSTITLATNWHGMGYELYTEKQIGKTVFLTKEDAEKHLK